MRSFYLLVLVNRWSIVCGDRVIMNLFAEFGFDNTILLLVDYLLLCIARQDKMRFVEEYKDWVGFRLINLFSSTLQSPLNAFIVKKFTV